MQHMTVARLAQLKAEPPTIVMRTVERSTELVLITQVIDYAGRDIGHIQSWMRDCTIRRTSGIYRS
jgi:hypothetical protein